MIKHKKWTGLLAAALALAMFLPWVQLAEVARANETSAEATETTSDPLLQENESSPSLPEDSAAAAEGQAGADPEGVAASESSARSDALAGRTEEPALPSETASAAGTSSEHPSSVNSTALNTLASPPVGGPARALPEFITEAVDDGLKITAWNGVFNDAAASSLIIPDTYPDPVSGTEKPVTEIAPNVFARKEIKEVTIGANVKRIGANAFTDNLLSQIHFKAAEGGSSALELIGDSAFANNNMSELHLPVNVQDIGANAFSFTDITELTMGPNVRSIGNYAFAKNLLTAVTLPESITSFGDGVFVDNGRFVAVSTQSPYVKKIEKMLDEHGRNRFGHVVDPIVVLIKCVDAKTGQELTSYRQGDDLTSDNVFVKGETVQFNTRPIDQYYAAPVIEVTPTQDNEVITVPYKSIKEPPVISLSETPVLKLNLSAEEAEAKLKSLASATDLTGEDISSAIELDMSNLVTDVPGSYPVIYRVTDRFGNTTEKSVEVGVADDWELYPVGNGWVMGDFEYSGTTLTGFSPQGLEKYKTNKDLVLPGFVLKGSAGNRQPGGSLTAIGSSAFRDKKLDSADFSNCENLEVIGDYAFRNTALPAVNFAQLPKLRVIGRFSFRETAINHLDFSPAKNLEVIDYEAFAGIRGGIMSLHFGELPKFRRLGDYALSTVSGYSQMKFSDKIDLSGLKALEYMGDYNFNGVPAAEIDLTGLSKLKYVGTSSFNSPADLNGGKGRIITGLETLTALEQIRYNAWQNCYLPVIDLSGMKNLHTIYSNAFYVAAQNYQSAITLPAADSKLRTIYGSSFEGRKISSLVIENLPQLSRIGARAFFNSGMEELKLDNLPQLQTIEDEAFANAKLTVVNFNNLPLLKKVPYKAFSNNTGVAEYGNKVVIYNLPMEDNVIPSASTFIVNPETPSDEAYTAEDFRYGMENGEWSILGFTDSGLNKLINGRRTIVFPGTDPSGRTVTGIAKEAFAGMDFDEADLTALGNLKVIGPSAFENANVKVFDFAKLPELREIGSKAFYRTKITEADFSANPELTKILSSAFAGSAVKRVNFADNTKLTKFESSIFDSAPLTEIYFRNLPNLTEIGSYAFSGSTTLSHDLDLTEMPQLEKINNYAFAYRKMERVNVEGLNNLKYLSGFNGSNLPAFDFAQVPAVETIGYNAFYGSRLGSVNLSPLTNLKTISSYAFAYSNLENVTFGDLTKLERIDSYAFYNNRLRSADLAGLTALKDLGGSYTFANNKLVDFVFPENAPLSTINNYVFSGNPLQVLELPASVTKVNDYAFYKYSYPSLKTALLTPEHDKNGNTLKDSPTYVKGGHIVDAKYVKVYYKTEDEAQELRPSYTEINTEGGSKLYYPLIIPGYVAMEGVQTIDFDSDVYAHEIVFHYGPISYEIDPNEKIMVSHTNVGDDHGVVGSSIVTRFAMDCTQMSAPVLEPVRALISFDPTYVESVTVGRSNFYEVDIDKDNGLITLTFPGGLTTGTKLASDIAWKFKTGPTPQNYELELPTELRQNNGQLITTSSQSGQVSFPKIYSTYNQPNIAKGFKDDQGKIKYNDGTKEIGAPLEVSPDNPTAYVDPEHTEDIYYYYQIGQSFNTPKLQRNIAKLTLRDKLPLYQALENGETVSKYAYFDQTKNPGWVLDEEQHEVTYVKEFPDGSDRTGSLAPLVLTYPAGVFNEAIKNEATVTIEPHMRGSGEADMVRTDDVSITGLPSQEPPKSEGGVLKRAENRFFRDYPTDKTKVFKWNLSFSLSDEDIEANKYISHLQLSDTLDPRMAYTALELPAGILPVRLSAEEADGSLVVLSENLSGTYTFTQPNSYTKLHLDFGEQIFRDYFRFSVSTELRDKDIVYNKEQVLQNRFANSLRGTGERFLSNGQKEADMSYEPSSDVVSMLPLELSVEPVKSSSYSGEMNSAGTPGSISLGVQRHLSDNKNSPSEYDVDIPNFKLIDVLPEGMMLVGEPRMTPEFAACPGAKVSTLFGYGNIRERVLIVYEADVLKKDVSAVGSFDTELDMLIKGGLMSNKAYMTFDKNETDYAYASPGRIVEEFNDGLSYMEAEDHFSVLEVNFINVAKYIRSAELKNGLLEGTSQWSNSGMEIPLGSYFQYLIRIDNLSEASTKNNEIFDVFPFEGDTVLQMAGDGKRASRLSRFANTFLDARIVSPETASDYKILYTETPINIPDGVEAGTYLKSLTWSETKPAAPTAMRIKPNSAEVSIDPGQSLLVQLDMMAPPDNTTYRILGGASAYNSCVRSSDETNAAYIETNRVYNRIPYPVGTLKLQKRSRVNDPETGQKNFIPGAEFSLINANGVIAARAVTDASGVAVFENVRIDDYILRETLVPEGYKTPASDLLVKAQDWMAKVDQNYLYDYGEVINEPVFAAQVIIEKTDGSGGPLQGVEFKLEKIGDAAFQAIKLRTDVNGRAEFSNLGEGRYKLSETRTLNNLKPNGVIKINGSDIFAITYPDQKIELTLDQNNQIINDKVNIRLFKIGLAGPLDPAKDLYQYSLLDGRAIAEDVTFELRDQETAALIPLQKSGDHWEITDLQSNKVYTLSETSVPRDSIYKRNTVSYDFKVDLKGKILSADGKSFKGKDIYFPNERKGLVGSLIVNKKDPAGQPLAGALFALNRYDEASQAYVPAMYDAANDIYRERDSEASAPATLRTNDLGQVVFPRIAAGSYELKELLPPDGYVGRKQQVRFLVEDAVNAQMMTDPAYTANADEVVHNYTIDAVNYPITMDFIKIEPIAAGVSAAEADSLLAEAEQIGKPAVKEKVGNYYDVYRPVRDAVFKIEEISGSGADESREVLKENLHTDEHGRLDLSGIRWKAANRYAFTETAVPDDNWLMPTNPTYVVNIRDHMLEADFQGNVRVRLANDLKKGQIVISKYERLNSRRLSGVTFSLYKCTLEEFMAAGNNYNQYHVADKVTGDNGFIRFADLELGTYVIKETAVPDDDFILIDTPIERTLTTENTRAYLNLYNIRNVDIFTIPLKSQWFGGVPEGETVTFRLSMKDPSNQFDQSYHEVETVTVKAGDDWQHIFKDLYAASADDIPYLYKVEQLPVTDYRTETSSFVVQKKDGKLKYEDDREVSPIHLSDGTEQPGLLFKNYRQMDILVRKTWDDAAEPSARPEQIKVVLRKNGTDLPGKTVFIKEKNGNWEHVFKGLDKTDADGTDITYSVYEYPSDYYYAVYSSEEGGRSALDEPVNLTLNIQNTVYPQVDLEVKKTLSYKTLPDQEFNFLLYRFDAAGQQSEELPGSVSNDENGRVLFTNVIRPAETGAENAVYYVIKEDDTVAYYSKDTRRVLAKVYMTEPAEGSGSVIPVVEYYEVVENNGSFSAGARLAAPPVFANSYLASGQWTPLAGKQLDGRPIAMGEFTFLLKQIAGKDSDDNNSVLQSKTNGQAALGDQPEDRSVVQFDALNYDQTDIGKTYIYEISEAAPTEKNMQGDASVYTAEVSIADAGAGHLNITAVYKNAEGIIVSRMEFANSYSASGSASPEAMTSLSGRALKTDEFSFDIKQIRGKDPAKDNKILETVKNGRTADGSKTAVKFVNFNDFSYDQGDIGKTYVYELREQEPSENGMSGDASVYTMTVVISDKGNGELDVKVSYSKDGETITGIPLFENTYEASGSFTPAVKKQLTGRALQAGEFSFALKQITGPDAAQNSQVLETVRNGRAATAAAAADPAWVDFSALSYDQTSIGKTYEYEISEVTPSENGMTGDTTVYTVVVGVSDAGGGRLNLTVTYKQGETVLTETAVFNNSYEASGSFTPMVKKVLSGRAIKAGEFNFALKQITGPDAAQNGQVLETVNNGRAATTNETADPTRVDFSALSYDQSSIGQTYQYEITEITPGENGMTGDTTVYTVVVEVTDAGGGQLNVAVTYKQGETVLTETAVFHNRYEASGSFTPMVKKELTGRALKAGEFSFALKQITGPDEAKNGQILETVKNGRAASADAAADPAWVDFTSLTYDQSSIGKNYEYEITELSPSENGMTGDMRVYTVLAAVTDAGGGKLNVTVTYKQGETVLTETAVFGNSYEATGSFTPRVKKELSGRALKMEEFNFELKQITGPDVTKNGQVLETVKNGRAATSDTAADPAWVDFSALSYDQSSIGQTYQYEITEVTPSENGMTGDTTLYTVVVVVSDAGQGKLNPAVTYKQGETVLTETAVFANSYEASGSFTPRVKKELSGRALKMEEFNFELKQITGPDVTKNGQVLETVKNGRAATSDAAADPAWVDFTSLTYDQSSIGESYEYEITELTPSENGMTGDPTVYTVAVKVTDAGGGKLNIGVTYKQGETVLTEPVVFNNSYEASGSFVPMVQKQLIGRALKMNEFSFALKQIAGPDVTKNGQVLETVKNGRAATADTAADPARVDFSALSYDQTSIGKTYEYEIIEVTPSENGMTGDTTVYTVVVEVTDAGGGKLNVAVTYKQDETVLTETAVFNNSYEASGSFTPMAKKKLTGRTLKMNEFSFELKQITGPDEAKNGQVLETVKNGRAATADTAEDPAWIDFTALSYDQKAIGKTYQYQIREIVQSENGMASDSSVFTLTINVSDQGNGQLNVKGTYFKAETAIPAPPVFGNIYTAGGSFTPMVKKQLTGRALEADEFSFALKQIAGPDETKNGQTLETVKNGRAATADAAADPAWVDFSALIYDQTSIGKSYEYEISEITPRENGMTGDPRVYTVVVEVSDAGQGQLNVDVTYKQGETVLTETAVFSNSYEAAGSFTPMVQKQLTGREIKAGEFSFNLKQITGPDASRNGQILETVKNGRAATAGTAADPAWVDFSALSYDQSSIGRSYEYEITEVSPTENGMTGDTTVYTVVAAVSDAGQGKLNVDVTYKQGETVLSETPVFNNNYEASGSFAPLVKKELTGRALKMNEFSFALKQIKGPDATKNGRVLETVKNGRAAAADAAADPAWVDFSTLSYDQSSIGRIYEYEITEVSPTETGMTGDTTVCTVAVEVTDAGQGKLNVAATYKQGETILTETPVFNNSYEASGSFAPLVKKELTGRALKMNEFSFALKQIKGPNAAQNGQVVETVKNGRAATADAAADPAWVDFSALIYDQTSIGKSYEYEISEITPSENGMTGDTTVYTVVVEVTDAGQGQLNVDVTYKQGETVLSETPVFNNSYEASGSFTARVKKELTGRSLKAGEFSFQLKQIEGPDESKNGQVLETVHNGRAAAANEPADPGQVDFSALSYDQTSIGRTYTYEITEVTPSENGMTGDTMVCTAVVEVTDAGDGKLNTEVTYQQGDSVWTKTPVFTNSYEASGSFTPMVQKQLNGRALKSGEFRFQLKQIEGPNESKNGQVLETVTNGRAASADTAADPARVDFSTLSYDQTSIGRTYTYEITEVSPTENGMTGDTTVYTVVVEVTDAGQGRLNVAVTYKQGETVLTAAPVFRNSYEAAGSFTPMVQKQLTGREIKAGEFRFNLKQITGPDAAQNGQVLETVTNGRAATADMAVDPAWVDFSALSYDQSSIGQSYEYEITEVTPSESGMTGDTTVYTVVVEVTDAGQGQLNVAVTYKQGETVLNAAPVFRNSYEAAGSFTPMVQKRLTGRALKAGEFRFNLKQIAGPDAAQNGQILETVTNGRAAAADAAADPAWVDFSTLTYDQTSIGKTYEYEITEVSPTENGMTGDTTVYTVLLTVTDAGQGKLNVAATYKQGETVLTAVPVFHNSYEAFGSFVPLAQKQLTGRALKTGEFSFVLKQIAGADPDKNGEILEIVSNGRPANADPAQVEFSTLTYDQTSIGKNYEYEITEVVPKEHGLTGDMTIYTVFVEVTDAGQGMLNVAVTYKQGETVLTAVPVFSNSYEASGSYTVRVKKELTGRSLQAGEFSFKLKQIAGPDESKNGQVLETVNNGRAATTNNPAEPGRVDFSALSYDQTSIGKTYEYEITEVAPTEKGMTGDTTVYTVHVEVTDAGDGQLNVTATYKQGETVLSDTPVFNNSYEASGSFAPMAQKQLTGRALKMNEFSFELKQIEGPDAAQNGEVLETVRNGRAATADEAADPTRVDFSTLSYDQTAIGRTYTYEITEVTPSENGMTGDTTVFTAVVEVTDAGGGKLNVDVTYKQAEKALTAVPVFRNSYEAAGSFAPMAQKQLTGRSLKMNEFSFELKQIEGPDAAKNGEVLETVRNGRAATADTTADPAWVDFSALSYDQASIGQTYEYEITEVTPTEKGMTGDTTVYTVLVEVTDAGQGKLNVDVTYKQAETVLTEVPVFSNRYEASGSFTPMAQKELAGRALQAGAFGFELKQIEGPDQAKNGQVLETVRNGRAATADEAADPTRVDFSTLSYDQTAIGRTYTYEISETAPLEIGLTGDSTVYTLIVAVSDAGQGQLDVQATYYDGAKALTSLPQFANRYEASGSFKPGAEVTLSGRELKFGEFGFELVQVDGPQAELNGKVIDWRNNGRAGHGSEPAKTEFIDFSSLSYTQDDAGKTYSYKIRQVKPEERGITADESEYTLRVKISDRGNGELGLEVQYLSGDETLSDVPVFHNIYEAEGSKQLTARKLLQGRELQAEEFRFALKQISGPDPAKNGQVLEIAHNGRAAVADRAADNTLIDFGALHYDQTSIGKTYTYEIREVLPTETGMSADDTTYTVEIEISDAGEGELHLTETYFLNGKVTAAPPVFLNAYTAAGAWAPAARKEYTGRDLRGGEFSFVLKQIKGPDASKDGQVIEQVKNGRTAADGSLAAPEAIDFTALLYDETAINQMYIYELREPAAEDPEIGITFASEVYTAAVQVSDEGGSRLKVEVTWTNSEGQTVAMPIFRNAYKAAGSLHPQAEVTLSGRKLTRGEFSFSWEQISGKNPADNGKILQTKANGSRDGEDPAKISFDPLHFDETDIGQTYTYKVTQQTPGENGLTGDSTVYTARVVITDAGNGKLDVKVSYNNGTEDITGNPIFKCAYKASGSWQPTAVKSYAGKELEDGLFSFAFKAAGETVPLQVKQNAADGTIVFDALHFSEEDINKTYTYELAEMIPSEPSAGVSYDRHTYVIKLSIEDMGNGILRISEQYLKDGEEETDKAVFENVFLAPATPTPEPTPEPTKKVPVTGETAGASFGGGLLLLAAAVVLSRLKRRKEDEI